MHKAPEPKPQKNTMGAESGGEDSKNCAAYKCDVNGDWDPFVLAAAPQILNRSHANGRHCWHKKKKLDSVGSAINDLVCIVARTRAL